MVFRPLFFGLLATHAPTHAQAANWAVLVAGSKGFFNYRHQADVCHSYKIMKRSGMPAENIILMMYDDVAHSEDNPFPGKLFNSPQGVDLYKICGPAIDYRGEDVNPDTFVGVLTGEGSGKVLRSTENDEVVVFFSDHGAPGLISFPNDVLHQLDLQAALQKMSDAKMFKKLVFYLETCYSGSMFQHMSIPGVYAVTAAGPNEPSWGAFCGSSAVVQGTNMNTCLGDLFSIAWMRNVGHRFETEESLGEQYSDVADRVFKSGVSRWGDLSFSDDPVTDFFPGPQQASEMSSLEDSFEQPTGTYPSTSLDLRSRMSQYENAPTSSNHLLAGLLMYDQIKQQVLVEHTYRHFAAIAYPGSADSQSLLRQRKEQPVNRNCELAGHRILRSHCLGLFEAGSSFALPFHQVIINVCHDIETEGLILDVAAAAQMACEHIGVQTEESLFGSAAKQAASGLLV